MAFYSQDEITAIELLQNNLKYLNLDEYKNSSEYLIRWLRARDMNIPKAEDMLRKSLKWREEGNIDSILSWSPPVGIQNFTKTELCGYDNEGCPIFITTYNSSDMEAYWAYDLSVHLRYAVHVSEQVEAVLKASFEKNKQTRLINVMDISGLDLYKFITPRGINHFGKISQLMNDNYPDSLKIFYITYAPRIFTIFFSMVKIFIPRATLEKIRVYGDNLETWKHEFQKDISIDQLPPRFGGTRKN